MLRSVLVVLVLLSSIPTSAYAGSKLSGDLFLTMRSGDVKRGADVQVVLVPATEAFLEEWEKVQSGYKEEVASAVAEYEALKQEFDSTSYSNMAGVNRRSSILNQQSQIANTRWLPAQRKYTDEALALIAKHAVASERTDVNGHYEIEAQPGRYFVYARYQVFNNLIYWFVPVEVTGDRKLSLSNSNGKTLTILNGRVYTAY